MGRVVSALTLVLGLVSGSFAQDSIGIFQPGSYRSILESNQGKPFVLVFWSLECTHCMEELKMLGEVRVGEPALALVLVSTDSPRDRTELQQVIKQSGVSADSSWVFAEANSPRLRFEVDPHWYGELPRTYFFDAQHSRRAVSGTLKRQQLEAWLKCCNHKRKGLDI